jgi:glycosyltransferase involved in cell wall biosynthesis
VTKNSPNTNLAIVATHPIQYLVPWFQSLSKRNDLKLKVYYIFVPDDRQQGQGFNHAFHWDIPLLDDYSWWILKSTVKNNSYSFFGTRIYQFEEQLEKDQIDSCLITGWQSLGLLQAVFSCRKLGIKTLVRGDSNSIRVRSFWNNLLHRILLKNFDAFLAVGMENKRFYLANGVDPDRIYWCPHFVDNSRFIRQAEAAKLKRRAIRRHWGILDHNVCFVFAGKLEPKKRLLDLIQALDIARKEKESIRLLVVGSGKQETQLRQLAISNSIPVTFTGFLNQTEISDAYVAADCLILPSDNGETWGLVVNEAMASGIPVLISDQVGCGSDLLISEKTGLTFNCGNIHDLSQKMIWMADNHNKLTSMGNFARDHIQKYTMKNATQGLLAAIDALKI